MTKLEKKYIRTDLLGLCRRRPSLDWTSLSSFSCHLDPFCLLFDSLKPSFPIHSLQIHCIGLFGSKFIHHLAWEPNCILIVTLIWKFSKALRTRQVAQSRDYICKSTRKTQGWQSRLQLLVQEIKKSVIKVV